MDRVSATLKYPPKPFVTLWQFRVIRGHEVKKVTFKISGLDGVIHVLMSDFRQERKNDHSTPLNGPNRTQFENRKMPQSS